MSFLKKANNILTKIILGIACTGMASITLIICLQVFCRYFLHSSLSWAEELALYIEVYIIFIVTGYALGTGQHICMDLVVSKVPKKAAFVLNKLSALACMAFSLAMTKYCYDFMIAETGQKMSSLPGYKWMVYLSMVIGFALMLLYSIVNLLRKDIPGSDDPEIELSEKEDK